MSDDLTIHPLTPERFADFEAVLGPRGAYGCWCMWWRLPSAEFKAGSGEGNRLAMKALVESGVVPGLLAYRGGSPVGWCAIAPRADYVRLQRSRILAPVDDEPAWSLPCFFIARKSRGQGVMTALLQAALAFAREHGARIVEAYPIDTAGGRSPDAFAYTGLLSTFERAGFRVAARRSARQPVVRLVLDDTGE